MLLARFLDRRIRTGSLTLIDAAGRTHRFGNGGAPAVAVRLHDPALPRRLFLDPELAGGEAYMDGTLTIEKGTLYDLVDLYARNAKVGTATPFHTLLAAVRRALRLFHQHNPVRRARWHAAHHYDLSPTLYELFLDEDLQYSCAYFLTPEESLETAQENKKRHIAAKLLLAPGQRILDIGSGFGGLALYLARVADAEVVGITLSEEQRRIAEARARAAGLASRVRFHLRDYREERGTYDRIVSVGMFEHVGVHHYGEFFGKVRDLLADDGVALLHSIARMEGPGATNPWIRKYIFPGGYTPALSEVVAAIEREDLWITDVEVLRLHYAETLKHWRERFAGNRSRIAELYDERFCRMWEFYLTGAEVGFRQEDHIVVQVQLARQRDAVPLVRDYVTDWERREREAKSRVA